ncbi:MAG: 4Fe-4S dicluster domain-containing protein [Desulfobacterales bacterium]|nr:4Fe-4S dicluster domain-containing protein [Desulfobacterales bacterium]
MGLLNIDVSKCKKDGICAKECPTAIIRLKDKESHPEMVPGGEQFCLICGHCVAVCPHGALSHAQVSINDCPPIKKELVITEEQTVQFLRSRRSIRFFKDKPVEKEKIQRLIEIGRYAPTASNSQLVEWRVLTDQAKIKEMARLTVGWMRSEIQKDPQSPRASYMPLIIAAWDAGYDAVLRGAPVMVVASTPKEANNGMVDLTLALSYLELAAPTLGIGACWAGLLQGALLAHPPLKEALGLPANHPHHYPMMLGYPKAKYYRLPERKPPKITWM